jgi:hypothetical protein
MKKSFALRVDEEVYDALEKWAASEFRSVNGQIEWILNEALKRTRRYPKPPKGKGLKPQYGDDLK